MNYPYIPQTNTVANYNKFANLQFPLECEGLDNMQANNALLAVLGNIGGECYLLSPLTAENSYSGYAFLKTADFPKGELLFIEPAGATTGLLCLKKTADNVTANAYLFDGAYTKRSLFHGVGGAGVEAFALSTFPVLANNLVLKNSVPPKWSIQPIFGSVKCDNLPYGWVPCVFFFRIQPA